MPRRSDSALVIGEIRGTRSGFAFLAPDTGGEDLFIPVDALGGAIHGDRVLATLVLRGARDFRPEAHVEEILDRPHPLFTGNIARVGRTWYVRPDSPLLPERIPLRLGTAQGVAGVKILFRVENRANRERTAVAHFEEILGDEDDAKLDPIVIASEFGLPLRFSEEALVEADQTAGAAGGPGDETREDFRGQFVLSIDPEDAKDFDDAVAAERLPGGDFELTVHIADVSFYVPEGGALDREAALRGTSVYFPGSVLPMLPDAISSVAASLGPEADKRVVSAILRFNPDGERVAARFARGWMRSRARLHYRQAQSILEGDPSATWPELTENLLTMADLAARLRRRRFRDGGFDLDVPETDMVLGPDGVPVRVYRHETLDSNRLIEEFMIAANRAIGEWAEDAGVPFLFRVHRDPDPEALVRFEETVFMLMPGTSVADLSSMPRLRRWISALPAAPLGAVIHRFFLRSMAKAVYSPVDIGHFGLGIHGYCHFTSPIRRYPDLFNHRRVVELLQGTMPAERWDRVHALATGTSRAEVNAEESGREMTRLKTARYMERLLGETFDGHVTALTPHGLFVEIDEFPAEGFVPRQELPPGVRYEGERMAWIEERSGWELRPADAVRVQVSRVDLRARRVEFLLLREDVAKRRETTAGGSGLGRRSKGRTESATGRKTRGRSTRAAKKRGAIGTEEAQSGRGRRAETRLSESGRAEGRRSRLEPDRTERRRSRPEPGRTEGRRGQTEPRRAAPARNGRRQGRPRDPARGGRKSGRKRR